MIKVEVWGPYALFTRPELKVERYSYEIPTPSAMRGLLESIYFHPGLRWVIDRIYVMNPIRFVSFKRNEVLKKIPKNESKSLYLGKKNDIYLNTKENIIQRSSMALQDVHYVIEAHFEMTNKANPTDNCGKFQDIIKRRLRKGQCYMQPYFGCREFTANFREWPGGKIETIDESRDFGLMLYDFDYSNTSNPKPMYFKSRMNKGVIDLSNCEVLR